MRTSNFLVASFFLVFSSLAYSGISLKSPETIDTNLDFYLKVEMSTGNSLGWFLKSDEFNVYFGIGDIPNNIITYDNEGNLTTLPNSKNGGWPIVRWNNSYQSQTLKSLREEFDFKPEYSLPNPLVESERSLGCLANNPLRLGDVDGDHSEDLVLIFQEDLVVFSPTFERIVFAARYHEDDWLTLEETDDRLQNAWGLSEDDVKPQYQSDMAAYALANEQRMAPGHRGLSKLFFGDFDNDNNLDVIQWSKLFRSNLENEAAGFHMLEDVVSFFERDLTAQAESEAGVTGEYLPQDTPEEDIKNWLAENNLTWSKGYPSKSECLGEEGQLIPEMHDPLLNDPDVLK